MSVCIARKNHSVCWWAKVGIILLCWFATCDAVWLQQEVRVDCKKSLLCGLQKTIHIIPVAKKV
jgi:hypothetical protein